MWQFEDMNDWRGVTEVYESSVVWKGTRLVNHQSNGQGHTDGLFSLTRVGRPKGQEPRLDWEIEDILPFLWQERSNIWHNKTTSGKVSHNKCICNMIGQKKRIKKRLFYHQ